MYVYIYINTYIHTHVPKHAAEFNGKQRAAKLRFKLLDTTKQGLLVGVRVFNGSLMTFFQRFWTISLYASCAVCIPSMFPISTLTTGVQT